MTQYSQEWWYANGQLAANQRAAVFGPGNDNTFAPIYSDPAMTVPLANPTTTDASGILTFYAPDGLYWIFVGPVGTGDSIEVVLGSAPGAVDSVNGQTGDVVLGAADVGAQPIATINAKGDLYAGTANDTTSRLGVGADGQFLVADSSAPTGLAWTAGGGGAVDSVNGQTGVVVLDAGDVGADAAGSAAAAAAASQPLATIDAKGDLYAGTANNATARLGVGPAGSVLTADAGQPTGMAWVVPAAAPVDSVNGQTGVVVLDAGDVGADPAGSAAAVAAASQPLATIDAKGDLYAGTGSDATARRSVGVDGQFLVADSSDPTGLAWSAGGGAVDSVNGQTGVVVLDAGDVGADPAGSAAAAAAVSQPLATINAKGDLYVGTANDTTARQGVGTDGFSLVADSTLTNGLKWAVASSIGMYPRSTGFIPAGAINTVRSSKSSALDVMFLSPVYILIGGTLSAINFEVTANIATAVVHLGLYGSDAAMLPTGAPLADYGQVAAATTGAKTQAVSTVLTPGLYWVAAAGQVAAPTLRFCAGQSPWVASVSFPAGSGVGWNNGFSQAGVSGALPPIGVLADTDVPLLGLKF